MKFKAERLNRYKASDGSEHNSLEAFEGYERGLLIQRIAGYKFEDYANALDGEHPRSALAADILTLASLLRLPRAKRKTNEIAEPTDPAGLQATEPLS